ALVSSPPTNQTPCSPPRTKTAYRPYLALFECFLIDMTFQSFRADIALIDAVLAEEEPVLEDEPAEREANHQSFPRKKRAVEDAGEPLVRRMVSWLESTEAERARHT